MLVLLFYFSLVSIREYNYKGEKWFIKGCLHLDQFVQKALSCSIISKKCCPQYKQVLALWPIYFLIFPECGLCLGITEYWIMKIENQ